MSVDLFDARDFDCLLSKRSRNFVTLALMIGIAFVPPVKSWYLGQIERHAQHITSEVQRHLTPELSKPSSPPTNDHAPRR